MGLIDLLMQQRTGMGPQAAQLQGGQAAPVPAQGQSAVSGAPPVAPQQQPGFFGRIGQGLQSGVASLRADPDKQAALADSLAMGFNSMRLEPDAQMAASIQQRTQNRADLRKLERGANRTAEVLRKAGETELAEAVLANPEQASALYAEYLKSRLRPQDQYTTVRGDALGMTGAEADALYKVNTATNEVTRVGAAGTTVNLGDGADEFQKALAKGQAGMVTSALELGPMSRDLLDTVSSLEQLSPYVGQDVGMVPGPLRRFLPEGVSDTVDAYTSQLNRLMSALRVPGSGAQSDKDVDALLAQGGSIASSPEARAIAHRALRRKGEINAELSQLATRLTTGQLTREQFFAQRQQLLSQPLLTEDDRAVLGGVAPGGAPPAAQGGISRDAALAEIRRRAAAGDAAAQAALREIEGG